MDKTAVAIIKDYRFNLADPQDDPRDRYFEKQSYSIWATNEIANLVYYHLDDDPVYLLEDFIHKMDTFADVYPYKGNNPFAIAKHVAEDILDTLYAAR